MCVKIIYTCLNGELFSAHLYIRRIINRSISITTHRRSRHLIVNVLYPYPKSFGRAQLSEQSGAKYTKVLSTNYRLRVCDTLSQDRGKIMSTISGYNDEYQQSLTVILDRCSALQQVSTQQLLTAVIAVRWVLQGYYYTPQQFKLVSTNGSLPLLSVLLVVGDVIRMLSTVHWRTLTTPIGTGSHSSSR